MGAYMHPQAIIIDSSSTEEKYFLSGVRDEIQAMQAALIELPERPGNRFSWLSKLDASALAGKAAILPRTALSFLVTRC
jgi:hypothetical protein